MVGGGGGGRHDVFRGVNPNDPTRESLNFTPGPPELFNRALLISYFVLVVILFGPMKTWIKDIGRENEPLLWMINFAITAAYTINRFFTNLSHGYYKNAVISFLGYPVMGYSVFRAFSVY